jgi:murein DD-endopeptidase MepM/ murein hydrolase activator NlpD
MLLDWHLWFKNAYEIWPRHQKKQYDPNKNNLVIVRNDYEPIYNGWDIVARPGTPVYAVADGELNTGINDPDFGTWINIRFKHNGQTYNAFYGHLKLALVRNCSITEGTIIAYTGTTGNAQLKTCEDAHLHFEITKEYPGSGIAKHIDPEDIFDCGIYELEKGQRRPFDFDY